MKTATAGLQAFLLSSDQFWMADLYAFQTLSGTTYYTSASSDITYNSIVYSAAGPLLKRTGTRLIVGTEVDDMTITAYPDIAHLIEGLPFVQAALKGALDDARVTVHRLFRSSYNAADEGVVMMFSGRVSDTSGSRNAVKLVVKSDLEVLTVQVPRTVYQSPCIHTLYGPGCGVQRASFQVSSSASTGCTTTSVTSALAQAADWFNQGTIKFTSGQNNGIRRTVKSFSSGTFGLILPLPYAPANGDTFIADPGCDKRKSTCGTKFSNEARHKAYPYVPAAETVF